MTIIIKYPGQNPYQAEIKGDLKSMQEVVGGYIVPVKISDSIALVCDEEGKIKRLEPNVRYGSYDILCGIVFAVKTSRSNFKSLNKQDIDEVMKYFEKMRVE